MPSPPPDLASLERWMRAVIVHPAGAAAGARSARARREIALPASRLRDVVPPTTTLSPVERLDVYSRMYFLRLRECLARDFPAVEYSVGHAAFDRLARSFLQVHPSRFYNLNRLGRLFPSYLAHCRWLPHRGFLVELAHLEWAMVEVFDAPGSPRADVEPLRALPVPRWAGVRFRLAPTVRLLAFDHPVNGFLQAFREGKAPGIPRPRNSWIAVYRRDFIVWRMSLTRTMFRLLEGLGAGRTLGSAIRSCLRAAPELERFAFHWFREWVSEGLFSEIHPPRRGASQSFPATSRGRSRSPDPREEVEMRRFATDRPAPVSAEAAFRKRRGEAARSAPRRTPKRGGRPTRRKARPVSRRSAEQGVPGSPDPLAPEESPDARQRCRFFSRVPGDPSRSDRPPRRVEDRPA
ncbi:MAG: DNA-binding domain-containing protein [Planctomycetes bacterium]|nr:DNA-binding domain-containing protein [Planctomycetota bacterium]